MLSPIPFAASALFLFTMSALAEESRISRVTLYAGSATVERSVAVTPEASRVELTGLPANFDVRSLRVEADPGIRIGEVSVRDIGRAKCRYVLYKLLPGGSVLDVYFPDDIGGVSTWRFVGGAKGWSEL